MGICVGETAPQVKLFLFPTKVAIISKKCKLVPAKKTIRHSNRTAFAGGVSHRYRFGVERLGKAASFHSIRLINEIGCAEKY